MLGSVGILADDASLLHETARTLVFVAGHSKVVATCSRSPSGMKGSKANSRAGGLMLAVCRVLYSVTCWSRGVV